MTATEIIREVQQCGVRLRVSADGERLEFAPASKLPANLLEELRRHKLELMRLIGVGTEPIQCVTDVFALARLWFPGREDLPLPPPRGRDPFARKNTDKAKFFLTDWRNAAPKNFKRGKDA